MFIPKYSLHTKLLNNIADIKNIIKNLNNKRFSDVILAEFEKNAYSVSAHASTSIEGNPIPLTDVKRLIKSHPNNIRDTEREVLNYNDALIYLDKKIKEKNVDFNKELICHIQKIVTDNLIAKKDNGKFRSEPVIVNDPKLRKVIYLPPNVDDVSNLMKELITFIQKEQENIDPLILSGIFHKQFVIIHPFIDGNGRTSRLITKYLLANMGLDTFNLFSFENYYNQNISKYFNHVGVMGDYYDIHKNIDFTDWLIYFTDGIIDELLRVKKSLNQTIHFAKFKDYEEAVIKYVKKHGSISSSEYKKLTDRKESTRKLDLKKLVDRGILIRNNKGKATFYTLFDDEIIKAKTEARNGKLLKGDLDYLTKDY